jgi:hypothetical protein
MSAPRTPGAASPAEASDCNPITPASRLGAADSRTTVQPCTVSQLCETSGVSRRMFFLAAKVQREACPDLWLMVRDGQATMNLAVSLVDLFPSHDDQRTVLRELETLPVRERLAFAKRVATLMKRGPVSVTGSPLQRTTSNPWQTDAKPSGFDRRDFTNDDADL